MESGKNQFLPFSKRLETVLRRVVMGSGKNQFLPLEVLGSYWEWQELVLATFSLICVSISIGKNWFLPFFKVTPDMLQWWQEPSDNLLSFLSGKYQYLPLFSCKKWQEPWQEPFLNYPFVYYEHEFEYDEYKY